MLGNVFKMIVVHLFLFSVLLYNTEAVFDDEYDKTTTQRSTAIRVEATIPVEDTTTTNRTETIGWSYGSGAVEKNETRDYKSVPVDDKRPPPVTETTDRWSYGSGAVEKNETLDYKTVPVENPAAVSDKEPANLTYEFAVTKPYEDDVGYFTFDSGTLTTPLPKESYVKKSKSKHVSSHSNNQHYSIWYKGPETYRTRTVSPYYWYNTQTTTTRRPYYLYWDKETDGYKNKTAAPYYGYNKTVVDSETANTRRPYYSYWDKETDGYKNKTVAPYYWYLNAIIGSHKNTTETSYYRYNQTVKDSATTSYNNRVVSPIVNRANSSDQNVTTDQVNPKTLYPVNISINSSINANKARSYGSFTDFFKKISGYILPSASNIATNSNITNLAVVNGNGNMFFFM